jgi:outer membrane protein OmpA-like peptidoglycan-associated protein
MKKMLRVTVLFTLVVAFLFTGCNASNAVKGGAIGVAAGGVLGGVSGKVAGNTTLGAIIGAAVGGTAGALIGHNMDKQAEEIENDIAGAKVERVGEGIKITFDSGILFQTSSSKLEAPAKANIEKLSKILNKYPDTNIMVVGFTDATGKEDFNMKLSEQRAKAVVDYTTSLGVDASRFTFKGLGPQEPVASNDTPEGRQANRRVEIAVFANEKLKAAAEKGLLK